jgi:hypothetical protein
LNQTLKRSSSTQKICAGEPAKITFKTFNLRARAGFGVTFYHDGVVLVEKGKGDPDRLNNLLADWTGCH